MELATSKKSYPCLELLKHVCKSLTKRPDFAERLPEIFLPSLELPPAQATDVGLLQAADALMEIAFAVSAAANPNPAPREPNRTKELEVLMARLYAEKRVKDEAQRTYKKALEVQFKKHLNEKKELEDRMDELLARLNRVQEDYELLQKETEEQAQAILAVSISSEGEPVTHSIGHDLSQDIMTDSTTERGLLLSSQAQPLSQSAVLSSITTPSLPSTPPPPQPPAEPSSLQTQSILYPDLTSSSSLASTLPLSQLVRPVQSVQSNAEASSPPQEPLQLQLNELEKSLLISSHKVSQAMEVMEKIENTSLKIHDLVHEITLALKGFETRLFERLDEFKVRLVEDLNDRAFKAEQASKEVQEKLQQATTLPASEIKDAVGSYHQSMTLALGQIIAGVNKLNSKLEVSSQQKPAPQEPRLSEELTQAVLALSKLKDKKRGQMKQISSRLEEIETLLHLESPTGESRKFKKIDLRLRAILAELKTKSNPGPVVQKAPEEENPLEVERRKQLLTSIQAAYSTILYLFQSLLNHAKIVQKVANISPQFVPSILNEKLSFSYNTSPLEISALLESLVQTTETYAPEVMIFIEDHLEILWQSQQRH